MRTFGQLTAGSYIYKLDLALGICRERQLIAAQPCSTDASKMEIKTAANSYEAEAAATYFLDVMLAVFADKQQALQFMGQLQQELAASSIYLNKLP